jgi:predicted signal transduction protein with EAL and GGDEF domain
VLRDADTAMYKAKAAGKARYALFDASLHTEVADRLRLEGDLRRAIDDGLLTVAYQPICELGSGHARAHCRLRGPGALGAPGRRQHHTGRPSCRLPKKPG